MAIANSPTPLLSLAIVDRNRFSFFDLGARNPDLSFAISVDKIGHFLSLVNCNKYYAPFLCKGVRGWLCYPLCCLLRGS